MNHHIIMGWDAAWTPNGSGAWAVSRGRELLLLETCPHGEELLGTLAEILRDYQPGIVAVDLPIAVGGVSGWRTADLETTRTFSKYGCPVHSPTQERPGEWGEKITHVLNENGYEVCGERPLSQKAAVEVYPHTANLFLNRAVKRIPYKVTRSGKYWPELGLAARKAKILEIHQHLWRRLGQHFHLPPFPNPPENPTQNDLKTIEDQIDALLCLFAGKNILSGIFQPYGTPNAAIWNPPPEKLPK